MLQSHTHTLSLKHQKSKINSLPLQFHKILYPLFFPIFSGTTTDNSITCISHTQLSRYPKSKHTVLFQYIWNSHQNSPSATLPYTNTLLDVEQLTFNTLFSDNNISSSLIAAIPVVFSLTPRYTTPLKLSWLARCRNETLQDARKFQEVDSDNTRHTHISWIIAHWQVHKFFP